ncbi:MAG: hypothetical protein OEL77_06585 [Nitrosopumilus sp.]|nr:hypothetical protein [Nitrosopumilus sp.]
MKQIQLINKITPDCPFFSNKIRTNCYQKLKTRSFYSKVFDMLPLNQTVLADQTRSAKFD